MTPSEDVRTLCVLMNDHGGKRLCPFEPATCKAQLEGCRASKGSCRGRGSRTQCGDQEDRPPGPHCDSIAKAGDHFNSVFKLYGEVRDGSIVAVGTPPVAPGPDAPGDPAPLLAWRRSPLGVRPVRHPAHPADSGHHPTIVVRGMAASMGTVLLQAADKRVVGREAMIMIHEVASLAWGRAFRDQDQAQLMDRLTRRTAEILSGGQQDPRRDPGNDGSQDVWLPRSGGHRYRPGRRDRLRAVSVVLQCITTAWAVSELLQGRPAEPVGAVRTRAPQPPHPSGCLGITRRSQIPKGGNQPRPAHSKR